MNIYVLESAKELAKRGYIVDVFTRMVDAKQPAVVHVADNFRVIHLQAGPQENLHKKELPEYIPRFAARLLEFQNNENSSYDILHAHYYLSGLVGLEVKKISGKQTPLVMCFHTLGLMKNLVARDELEREEKERIDAECRLVTESEHLVVTGVSDSEYLLYLYNANPQKVSVIQPGVDTGTFYPMDKALAKSHIGAGNKDKIILFVGRIEPLKGIDSLLYAMKILRSLHPEIPACLWIVGGDIAQKSSPRSKELQKLEKLRHFLSLTTTVRFVGQQPQKELPYFYNASELVVMPSHYESFGMAELEAMACGTPVITTNVTGIGTLIDKKSQKLITTANNPLLLARQMADLLCNRQENYALGKRMMAEAHSLQWKQNAIKTIKLYKRLVP